MKKENLSVMLLLMGLFLVFEGCSPFSKVYSEEEPGVNLFKYHTYDWLNDPSTKQGNKGPEWLTDAVQQKLRSAVEEQMGRYGFKPCTEKPDLMLHYHVVVKNEVLYVPDWSCDGQGGGEFSRCHRVNAVNYREGTLIIDFIETKNGNQVWRGAAVGILDNLKAGELDGRIKDAAKAIFKKFPEKPIPVP